jgi:hypothetical protein
MVFVDEGFPSASSQDRRSTRVSGPTTPHADFESARQAGSACRRSTTSRPCVVSDRDARSMHYPPAEQRADLGRRRGGRLNIRRRHRVRLRIAYSSRRGWDEVVPMAFVDLLRKRGRRSGLARAQGAAHTLPTGIGDAGRLGGHATRQRRRRALSTNPHGASHAGCRVSHRRTWARPSCSS